jgi:signal transduction histidine kinase
MLSGDNGLYVTVEITDTGTGMSESTLEKLFEPYFTTKGDRGTGLGMVVIQQIVTLAGGFIDIDSKPGHGTCVRIRLPRIGSAKQAA